MTTSRRARIILIWIVIYVVAMALVGAIFGSDVTWRTVVFTASVVFFIGSCQLVIERDREKRADLDKFRSRATPPASRPKLYIAGGMRGQYDDPIHREGKEKRRQSEG